MCITCITKWHHYIRILGPVSRLPHQCRHYILMNVHRTARVWKNFQFAYELVGHTQSVWAVVAIEPDQFLTGEFGVRLLTYVLTMN